MTIKTLQDLYLHELQDLYDAENQILKALPKMMKSANSEELKAAFEQHMAETEGQISRLEQVFESLNEKAKGQTCKGIAGIIAEGEEMMTKRAMEPAVMDAALIGAAQKVEHYEICGYGTARAFAEQVGHQQGVTLLQQTLREEEKTDKLLTKIAKSMVNVEAEQSAG